MTLASQIRAASLKRALDAKTAQYARNDLNVSDLQLERLNHAWEVSLAISPYARALREQLDLPEKFESWASFDAAVPTTEKATLRPIAQHVRVTPPGITWRATGGSTGEPFRFPTIPEELALARTNIWLGRRWIGVSPSDPVFLIWGHAHQLGDGLNGRVNKLRREISDGLMGYVRHSAYDLAPDHLDRAAQRLLKHRPRYVVGYSSALDKFARHNAPIAEQIEHLAIKAVIATAEPFPRQDSVALVGRTFGADVFMEYGATETGPLAQQTRDGLYQVYWTDFRISARQALDGQDPEILVTSLHPRALPLLNYALGDAARPFYDQDGAITRLERVAGACNETVPLPDGRDVHYEAFSHCVHDASGVDAFQIVRRNSDWPLLRYSASKPITFEVEKEVRRRLGIVSPGLARIEFVQSDTLTKSIAGKHRVIVDE
jgi:phenylacetate-coenzyme A ligase PaaK-like adenylate-forming protein